MKHTHPHHDFPTFQHLLDRRHFLRSVAAGALAFPVIVPRLHAEGPETGKPFRSADFPRFRGPFPILSTPFKTDGAVDFEVLARSARFVDWCESPGMIWPQSNDSVDLLTRDEKLEGMEVLARTSRDLKTTALCLGVQGEDTDDMLVYAKLRGVFDTLTSREYGPGGTTPAKPLISHLKLSQDEIAEIEWRFEELRPHLKPGRFEG